MQTCAALLVDAIVCAVEIFSLFFTLVQLGLQLGLQSLRLATSVVHMLQTL